MFDLAIHDADKDTTKDHTTDCSPSHQQRYLHASCILRVLHVSAFQCLSSLSIIAKGNYEAFRDRLLWIPALVNQVERWLLHYDELLQAASMTEGQVHNAILGQR
jgi:hypothetical protein